MEQHTDTTPVGAHPVAAASTDAPTGARSAAPTTAAPTTAAPTTDAPIGFGSIGAPTSGAAFGADAPRFALPPALSGAAGRFALRRSRTDRMLGGVCGGLADGLGADPALLRVLLVALTLITGGAAAVVYVAAWALAPQE